MGSALSDAVLVNVGDADALRVLDGVTLQVVVAVCVNV